MKASSISVRIADFLKEYPPFEFLGTAVLRDMAGKGKVTFHEDGEIIFSQGQPRNKWVYVIQQGNVRVIDEKGETEELIDLRGPGDILGLQGIRSSEPYLHTCRTETETILYALPRDEFTEVTSMVPEARRYLAATFSLGAAYQWRKNASEASERQLLEGGSQRPVTLRKGGLWEVAAPHKVARQHLVTVMGDRPIGEVARLLRSKRVDIVIVINAQGRAIGKVTDADLRDRLVEGSLHPQVPVRDVMFTDLVPASPGADTAALLLKMTRYGKHFLVITEDGTRESRVTGCVSERNLFLQYGRFPTVIGEAISSAPDVGALRLLRDRVETLLLEFLHERDGLPWLMQLTGALNRRLSRRVVELVEQEMEAEGQGRPPVPFCWLLMGSGGRDELLIRSAVYHSLVYADPSPREADRARHFFHELAHRVGAGIRQCGFRESPQHVLAQEPGWCLPFSAMADRFRRMIADPVGTHVYSARDAFDFKAASEEEAEIAVALRKEIETALKGQSAFIEHMARDSLLNQPPRTLFQGYVVEGDGMRKEELAIKHHALLPLVDVARVLALEAGTLSAASTHERFLIAAERMDGPCEQKELLEECSRAFLLVHYARVSQGLQRGTDGSVIRPIDLNPEIRTLLVTSFRTILRLLEMTAQHFGVPWRK